ncbi:GntR family transcriptional regulator [Paracoccus yeei]|uniref:GntR family transcriptional regulator n=1 Tax=Paracoccus yeei TaxID=147645 RepID=A0A2D2C7P4_9RHOB|nr:GntR family transcriptional regulator [Paracoccus yeei]ATQ58515.1 GntR family transcriptional regulator [Paracoccus yeei]MBY0136192.1 GntR family transcriptional regulator [Paracoccus yeei]
MPAGPAMRIAQPPSLATMVAERLRDAIIDGEFTLGENISEERLCAAFGVSRSPVRDALNALQFTGLVEVRPKRGSFVFNPTEADVARLCDYRFMLEREAALMAVRVARDDLAAGLEAAVATMARAHADGDRRAYGHADTAYHGVFFACCGNSLVRDAYRLAEAQLATLRTLLTAPFDERRESGLTQHRDMAEALLSGDEAGFAAMLKVHADWSGRLTAALQSQQERNPG